MAGENQEYSGVTKTKQINQGEVSKSQTNIKVPTTNIINFPADSTNEFATLSDKELLQHFDAVNHPNPRLQKDAPIRPDFGNNK